MKKDLTIENIEAYVGEKMSVEEKLQFEKQMQADPLLQKEVELQRNVISGIQNARKAELKAMLNNVVVPKNVNQGTLGSAGKWAASILVATSVGIGTYLYVNSNSDVSAIAQKNESVKEVKSIKEPVTLLGSPHTELKNSKAVEKESASTKESTATKNSTTIKTKVQPVKKILKAVDKERRSELKSKLELNKDQVYYQFTNHKLQIWGLEDTPHEILEIDLNGDKNIYLSYENNFYQIEEKHSEPTPVKLIEEENIITRLKEVQLQQSVLK